MKNGKICKINGLKYPSADNINGRTSTICRSMACTLLAREGCSQEEEKEWMRFFSDGKCAYCGKNASHLDHLYPLIEERKPTGYCTEPANLVPCCRECNQPKGNMYWEDFMKSEKCHHVGEKRDSDAININIAKEKRISNMKAFQKAMPASKVEISDDILKKWDELLKDFDERLENAQRVLLELKSKIYDIE